MPCPRYYLGNLFLKRKWKIIRTSVKKGAAIGVNSTIICGVTIGTYSMVGGGSVVTKDVPDHGLVFGSPAKLKGFVCFCGCRLEGGTEKGKSVVFKCKKCKKSVSVPRKTYDMMEVCE